MGMRPSAQGADGAGAQDGRPLTTGTARDT